MIGTICKELVLINVFITDNNLVIDTKSRILQINQTIENTYNFKISFIDKANNQINDIEDRKSEFQQLGETYANETIVKSEISINIMPEEIYLMKKFLDVIILLFILIINIIQSRFA